jgi:MerR family transcriptional regulator, thiopeptide resistance regulator
MQWKWIDKGKKALDPSPGDDPQNKPAMDSPLSPAETAQRFGISIKALRLYEQHGLLKPLRAANGRTGAAWRVYGSDQVARLHQILTLKRLGLSLGQIGELLVGQDTLDPILAIQERVLSKDSERITRALTLIRKARTKLASGDVLSIDDLATLTQETVMTTPTAEAMKEILTPFTHKHLTPQERAGLREETAGQPDDVKKSMKQMLEEAKVLMTSGDATTVAAIDLARRFRATVEHLKLSEPSHLTALKPKLKAMMDDALSDPTVSTQIEVLAFVKRAMANLKAQEENSASEK